MKSQAAFDPQTWGQEFGQEFLTKFHSGMPDSNTKKIGSIEIFGVIFGWFNRGGDKFRI